MQLESTKTNTTPSLYLKISNIDHWDNKTTLQKKFKDVPGLIDISRYKHKPAILQFDDEKNKTTGFQMLKEMQNKKKKMLVVTEPNSDEIQKHIKFISASRSNPIKRKKAQTVRSKNAKESVTPWANIPYPDQLDLKAKTVINSLKTITKTVLKETPNFLYPWIKRKNAPCCEFEDITGAEKTEFYRNKDSQTIGFDSTGNLCVGYRVGRFEEGSDNVEASADCTHIPESFQILARKVREILSLSDQKPFNNRSKKGVWRRVEFKSGNNGRDIRLTLQIDDSDLQNDELKTLKTFLTRKLKESEEENSSKGFSIIEAALQIHNGLSNFAGSEAPTETLFSNGEINETMNGLTFKISPGSFFQVNTEMAEKLYSAVSLWAECDENTVVLDICCGTGTIGLTLASKCKKVIGFELVESSIKDAKENALRNGIENAEWYLGKAQETIGKGIKEHPAENVIAVVDPPRSGVERKVLKTLRENTSISSLLYVSCNPASCVKDICYLVKKESKKRRGDPFVPVKSTAFDLFPQTPHCEMLTLLKR